MANCHLCGRYTPLCYHCGETVCDAPYCKFHKDQQDEFMGVID